MELHGANVVEVAVEREEAAVSLVVPHLYFVIVTCCNALQDQKHSLRRKGTNKQAWMLAG